MDDKEWALKIYDAMNWNLDASEEIKAFRSFILKEAADRAAFYVYADTDCEDAMALKDAIFGDHASYAMMKARE